MRTTSAAMSGFVVGRPGRRVFAPSYCWATSFRYQRRIVSGVTMPATAARRRRPRTWPFTARRRRWSSVQSPRAVHRAEDTVLLDQVLNHFLLVATDPAR